MKLLAIGKTNKLKFETKKFPKGKAFTATEQAMADAKKIGTGKTVKATWTDDYKIQSLEEYTPKLSGKYRKGSVDALNRQSAVKSASNALAGIDGVTVANYETIYKSLIEIGYTFISNKSSAVSEDEFENNNTEDQEFGAGEEEKSEETIEE